MEEINWLVDASLETDDRFVQIEEIVDNLKGQEQDVEMKWTMKDHNQSKFLYFKQ